jgi:hypothetical protein
MWGRKILRESEETLDEHIDSRFSHLPSSPSMPTISLALLQKVPTEKQVSVVFVSSFHQDQKVKDGPDPRNSLTLLKEGGVENAVNVPHTSELQPISSPWVCPMAKTPESFQLPLLKILQTGLSNFDCRS